ncbi:MAG TPA: protein kinase [Terracidiphilus sp.]|nr:protein kinase [Terracidiphilus sp.]
MQTMNGPKRSFSEGEIVAGNYRILAEAGSGGMGVVYRALDLRLNRTVALKFLPPELNAGDKDKERFLREARTASSLDHPNIGVIHGVEATPDGSTFIVMAFYEGSTLAQHMQKGPIPVHQAIGIVSQVATGLAEAHTRGIVHRDIKPSNVILTASGLAKIVDFGLARVVSEQTASQTGTGITGTFRYMSPEQAMGRRIDRRSDIWSLGVVFAEMLNRHSPFPAETIPAMILAILNSPPVGIENVHPALQPVLYRALAKEADRRYDTCTDFLADLDAASAQIPPDSESGSGQGTRSFPSPFYKSGALSAQARRAVADASRSTWQPSQQSVFPWRKWLLYTLAPLSLIALFVALVPPLRHRVTGLFATQPQERHIAVLPFDIIGTNPETTALADGLMDSLAGRLSNLNVDNQSLWVVPNSEVRHLNVTDPSDALKQLGANLVVKGSVQRDGNDIHLSVNLIDTKQMRQIGSAELEDPAGDLSTLENEAVARLAQLMDISVTAGMLHDTGGSLNPAAYEDYLTALGYMQRTDKPDNLNLAIAALQKSIQTDPRFALGYAQLGEAYREKYQQEQDPHWLTEAQAVCQKAAEIDSSIPAIYVTLARIHDALGKHDLALQEFQHALALNPHDAAALIGLAVSYESSGRVADAEKIFQKAAVMRPNNWEGYNELGAFYDRQGKYPQAIAAFKQALQITPDNSRLYYNMAAAYLDAGDKQSQALAEQAIKKSISINPSYPAYANLGLLYLEEKRYAESAAATEQALHLNGNDYMVWNNLLLAEIGAKEPQKAQAARQKSEQLAEQLVALKPQDALAQSTLAILYASDKRKDKAISKIQTSLALAPEDPNVLSNVGEAYEMMGNRLEAIQYETLAVRKGYALQSVESDPDLQALVADPRFKPPGK